MIDWHSVSLIAIGAGIVAGLVFVSRHRLDRWRGFGGWGLGR